MGLEKVVADAPFARPDFDRAARQGAGEVIYGEGKTAAQVAAIARALIEAGQPRVLATRVEAEKAAAVEACWAATGGDGQTAVIRPCPTHAELAALLGSQREPVTRELNRLASLDIVRQNGRTLHVLNVPALAAEVERIGGEV